jgi:Tol biopolymer transport system component
MAPDGKRIAVHVAKAIGGWEILVVDLETGVPQRIEVAGNYRAYPGAWAPDGQSIMVGLFRPVQNVFLGARMYDFRQNSWEEMARFNGSYMTIAPNGREFVYSNWRTGDLFIRPLRGDTTSRPIPARGWAASFSPDGKFLAWGGADGGVSVSPLPPTGAIYPVAERGQQPLWTPDGKRLIYRDGRRFMQVNLDASSGTFRSTRPELLAEGPVHPDLRVESHDDPGGTDRSAHLDAGRQHARAGCDYALRGGAQAARAGGKAVGQGPKDPRTEGLLGN